MITVIFFIIMIFEFAVGSFLVDVIRRRNNQLLSVKADLSAWQASCATLEATIKRYELAALKYGLKPEPPLNPMPMSASSESRWKRMQND